MDTHTIHYKVDDIRQTTTSHELTPRQILSDAKIDPANHYLVQIEGHHKESYKDRPNEPIHMHDDMKFISISTGPTPVS